MRRARLVLIVGLVACGGACNALLGIDGDVTIVADDGGGDGARPSDATPGDSAGRDDGGVITDATSNDGRPLTFAIVATADGPIASLALAGDRLYFTSSGVSARHVGAAFTDGGAIFSLESPTTSVFQVAANTAHVYWRTNSGLLATTPAGAAPFLVSAAGALSGALAADDTQLVWQSGPYIFRCAGGGPCDPADAGTYMSGTVTAFLLQPNGTNFLANASFGIFQCTGALGASCAKKAEASGVRAMAPAPTGLFVTGTRVSGGGAELWHTDLMDGGGTFAALGAAGGVVGDAQHVYFVDQNASNGAPAIMRMDANGANKTLLAASQNTASDLVGDDNAIYWARQEADGGSSVVKLLK